MLPGEITCYTTKKLNNGWRVAARVVHGELEAYKFANLTQARAMADKLNAGDTIPTACWHVTPGRPFYVRVDRLPA